MRFPNLSNLPLFPKKKQDDGDIAYANLSARSFAVTTDLLLLLLFLSPVYAFISEIMFPEFYLNGVEAKVKAVFIEASQGRRNFSSVMEELSDLGLITKSIFDYMVQVIVSGCFIIFSWVKWSSTPGMMLFRMHIADANTGEAPSLMQYFVRYIFGVVSIASVVGMLFMFFNKRKMAMHDMVAGTVVLHRKIKWRESFSKYFKSESEENSSSKKNNEGEDKLRD